MHALIASITLLMPFSAFAGRNPKPTVCIAVIAGTEKSNGPHTTVSCDGAAAERLEQKSKSMIEEQSAQLAFLTQKTGLRLVSCQMTSSPKDTAMETVCVLGR